MRDFFKTVLYYIKPYKSQAILNIVFNLLASIFSLFSLVLLIPFLGILFGTEELVTEVPNFEFSADYAQQYFYYYMSSVIIESGKTKALLFVSLFVLAMILLKNVFAYFANFFMAALRNGVVMDIRNRIYKKVLNLHIGFFSEEKKGDIISRQTSDVQEFEWSAMSSIEMVFRDPIMIIIFLTTLFFMSPTLTLFILILLPISGIIIGRIGKSLRKSSKEFRERMGNLITMMEETIGGLRIIKAFIAEKKVSERFEKENNKYTRLANKIFRREYLASPMSEFLGVLSLLIVLYYGATLVLGGESEMKPQVLLDTLLFFPKL
jgi:subfamily B ATP-binding cassette protein MsbA